MASPYSNYTKELFQHQRTYGIEGTSFWGSRRGDPKCDQANEGPLKDGFQECFKQSMNAGTSVWTKDGST
ncbi:hypothetical protein TNCV_2761771 [Trichonephila clavipes]|nr:hypothetical protein TNCV_2761771 [Trichonephila clavipes]